MKSKPELSNRFSQLLAVFSLLSILLGACIPTPTDTTPPEINGVVALEDVVFYPAGCGENQLHIGARILDPSDTGMDPDPSRISETHVRYRYQGEEGYVGDWHTVSGTFEGMGSQFGFLINVGSEAGTELGTQNGNIEFQVFATDNSENTSAYPDGYLLGRPVIYCATLLTCGLEDDLLTPIPFWPGEYEVVSNLAPTHVWDYPGRCKPDHFQIQLLTSESTSRILFEENIDGSLRSWTPPDALTPGTFYEWRVKAFSEYAPPETSETAGYFIGPICSVSTSDPTSFLAPIPLFPADGAVARIWMETDGRIAVGLGWNDPTPCLAPGGYKLEVSRNPDFPADDTLVVLTREINYSQFQESVNLRLPGETGERVCERFYWRVKAELPGDADGPYSDAYSFIVNQTGGICPTDLGPLVTVPPPDVTPTVPMATLLQNANCRRGPSIDYESLTTLFKGLEVPIDGRNADKSWWWVRIPNSVNHCWLAKENVQTSGDTSKVPIVEAEPLGCWVKQQQGPDKCVAPCPQGAQPGGACEP